jgi:hypothetical protein
LFSTFVESPERHLPDTISGMRAPRLLFPRLALAAILLAAATLALAATASAQQINATQAMRALEHFAREVRSA